MLELELRVRVMGYILGYGFWLQGRVMLKIRNWVVVKVRVILWVTDFWLQEAYDDELGSSKGTNVGFRVAGYIFTGYGFYELGSSKGTGVGLELRVILRVKGFTNLVVVKVRV